MIKLHSEDGEKLTPLWLITFTDLMALLLTFFVLLYSMSSPLEHEGDEVFSAFGVNLQKTQMRDSGGGLQEGLSFSKVEKEQILSSDYLVNIVKPMFESERFAENAQLFVKNDRVILQLPKGIFFEEGCSVRSQSDRMVGAMADFLSRIGNPVMIGAGHDLGCSVSLVNALQGAGYKRSFKLFVPKARDDIIEFVILSRRHLL